MSLQPNNANKSVAVANVWPHDAGVVGSAGFRKAFFAVASRLGRVRGAKPITYALEREKHQGTTNFHVKGSRLPPLGLPSHSMASTDDDVERGSLFLLGDFSLPDFVYTPLPLYLPRPEYMEVPRESIKVIDPVLAEYDVGYIRDILADNSLGPSMFQMTNKYRVKESSSTEVRIVVEDPTTSFGPTHMLAVYGHTDPLAKRHINLEGVWMFPIHNLVLAPNCAKLPPFPPPHKMNPQTGKGEFRLPVVSLFPSSPLHFPMLLEYLYLKRPNVIFSRILGFVRPITAIPPPDRHEEMARIVARRFSLSRFLDVFRTITHVWDDACYLGVYDDELWDTLDMVRKVVLMGLAICKGRLDTFESIKAVAAAVASGREREPIGGAVELEEGEIMTM